MRCSDDGPEKHISPKRQGEAVEWIVWLNTKPTCTHGRQLGKETTTRDGMKSTAGQL